MKNFVLIIFTLSAFFIDGFSQSNQNVAPVKWEKYKISDKKVTVLFPKLPVKLSSEDKCSQISVTTYYAYAEEVVYKLNIFEKHKEKFPSYCTEKIKFTDNSFSDYKNSVQTEFGQMKSFERKSKTFFKGEKISNDFKTSKWLLNDYQNLRWFEFTISTHDYTESNESNFVDSLSLTAELPAIEIAGGSYVILGDELTAEQEIEDEKKKERATKLTQAEKEGEKIVDAHSSPLNIIVKPKPKYTEEARQANLTGNVRVRVTFLPNGAIGSVSPLNDLGYGLTEQAVAAAKQLAFLPQKRNDWNLAVTKVVVYNFTIY